MILYMSINLIKILEGKRPASSPYQRPGKFQFKYLNLSFPAMNISFSLGSDMLLHVSAFIDAPATKLLRVPSPFFSESSRHPTGVLRNLDHNFPYWTGRLTFLFMTFRFALKSSRYKLFFSYCGIFTIAGKNKRSLAYLCNCERFFVSLLRCNSILPPRWIPHNEILLLHPRLTLSKCQFECVH